MQQQQDWSWLRDVLPGQDQDQHRARLMSFGYNAKRTFAGQASDIEHVARQLLDRLSWARRGVAAEKSRPTLFIAHGLGGAIVKKVVPTIAHIRDWFCSD